MATEWYEYAINGAIFAGILLVMLSLSVAFFRVRVQKWIGGAIGNFMTNLAKQAAEEEGSGSGLPGSGVLNLGGFKIDPQLIQLAVQYGPKLLELAKQFGLVKGEGGGMGGFGP